MPPHNGVYTIQVNAAFLVTTDLRNGLLRIETCIGCFMHGIELFYALKKPCTQGATG